MLQLDEKIIAEHYAHISDKPFFPRIKIYMQKTPIVVIAVK
jgi:nucleoside-diphosphate kinase